MIYALNGQYTTLISDIGIDAEVGHSGRPIFRFSATESCFTTAACSPAAA